MDNVSVYIPISKIDPDKRMVYGYASTEALDSQGEIVTKDAIKAALPEYMKFANVREMHQSSAVGKAVEVIVDDKGLYVGTKVVDDTAWNKVKEGVYNGYSIGGRSTKKVDGLVHGLQLTEISLVDRPANPETVFTMFKMEASDMKKADEIVEEAKSTETEVVSTENPVVVEETKTEEVTPIDETVKVPEGTEDKSKEEAMFPKEKSDTDKTLATILEKITKTEMPTEDELAYMLKSQNQPVTTDTLRSLKDIVAGSILEKVSKSAQKNFDKDAATDAYKKSGHKEDMIDIFKALEVKLTDLSKANEVERLSGVEKKTEVVEKTGRVMSASNMDKILSALNQVVTMVQSFNGGGSLSQEDQDAILNGVSGGSEVTSQDVSAPQDPSHRPAQINRVDDSTDLTKTDVEESTDIAKVQGELSLVKEQLQKILSTPETIKAKASYVTVEKVIGGENGKKDSEAKDILGKIDANYQLMKQEPLNKGYQTIAEQLSKEYHSLIHT